MGGILKEELKAMKWWRELRSGQLRRMNGEEGEEVQMKRGGVERERESVDICT